MAISNRERVNRGLTRLRDGLRPICERHWAGRYGDNWLRIVNRKAPRPEARPSADEPSFLLRGLIATWDEVWSGFLRRPGRRELAWVREIEQVSGRVTRKDSFTIDEAQGALGTIDWLLVAFGVNDHREFLQEHREILLRRSEGRLDDRRLSLQELARDAGPGDRRVIDTLKDVEASLARVRELLEDLSRLPEQPDREPVDAPPAVGVVPPHPESAEEAGAARAATVPEHAAEFHDSDGAAPEAPGTTGTTTSDASPSGAPTTGVEAQVPGPVHGLPDEIEPVTTGALLPLPPEALIGVRRPPRDTGNGRLSFSKIPEVLPLPDLLAVQRESFEWFLEEGLSGILERLSPIEDFSGSLALDLSDHYFGDSLMTIEEAKERDVNYAKPLHVIARFVNRITGEIKEQRVFLGDFPMMTDNGTFIINGTERVVVSQLVRSPGVYFDHSIDKTSDKDVYGAKVIPGQGAWMQFDIDKRDTVGVRVDRKRRQYVTAFIRALGIAETDSQILEIFDGAEVIRNTLEKDPEKDVEGALLDLYRKQRPGEPPSVESARGLIHSVFRNPKRFDLTSVGRYKVNQKFQNPDGHSTENGLLTDEDLINTIRYMVHLKEGRQLMTTALGNDVPVRTDDTDHFGNRRVRTVGELVQNQIRVGLSRMERQVRERMTTQDPDAITPQTLINIRPVVGSIKEFFGSSQLSQFMDQPNPLAGLTHRRRLSALGPGGVSRERAGFEVRDVHPSHYGRMCPIETPEGPNIGLIGSLASYARVNRFGFIETPYRKVEDGRVIDAAPSYLTASEEERYVIAQANAPLNPDGSFLRERVLVRRAGGDVDWVPPREVDYMDVSPKQIVSVATSLIPFLEHDDANRALMGSNMQRQAVPLLESEAPLVGTGVEARAAQDSGDLIISGVDGVVLAVTGDEIVVRDSHTKRTRRYPLRKFERSNQGTSINQKPLVVVGEQVSKETVIADGPSTEAGELALGKNLLAAFMPWKGHNFEDAIVLSERLVKHDVLTSIHIEEHEIDARDTKLGAEEITRDIPNVAEEVLRDLDDEGIVRVGAEVGPGDYLVGKVTPKGETEMTPEERLLRAIFGEKAREVRDSSLKVPHGESGKVIDVKVFRRADGFDDLNPGVNQLVRVYVASQRKIAEGDKLAGRHGNKGVIAKILPEEDMPFLADGTPVDIVLSPLGVPSRMNLGQVLETHLGWAAAQGWRPFEAEGQVAKGRPPWSRVATPVFDGARQEEIAKVIAHSLPNRDGERLVDDDGKAVLYDGRTGTPFDHPVTVGYLYILKLVHLVDDKLHARSTGPYSMITQQPLGGKAQFGGQRFGEMEVWALEAYGAAYALQELLTIKSDDVLGRVKVYESIVKGDNIPEPGVPESFKVLIKEMQSLCLNVELLSAGEEIQFRDLDEDLYRATESLGIDLSRPERREEG